jgi:hypothetical protein
MLITTLVIVGVLIVLVMIVVGIYNKLVTLKNRFENAFSQIEVQLQRRYDLIPNLIETVKGYMAHEKETLEAVIQARNQAQSSLQAASQNPGDASAIAGLAGAEGYVRVVLWAVSLHCRKVIRILKPIKIWQIYRKSSVQLKTKSPFPGRHLTTQSLLTTPISKPSLQSFLLVCLDMAKMALSLNSKAKKLKKLRKFNSNSIENSIHKAWIFLNNRTKPRRILDISFYYSALQ